MNTNKHESGKTPPNYGMCEAANRRLAEVEKILRETDADMMAGMLDLKPEDAREMMEICDDGVASIKAASEGVAPAQKVMVGVAYTVDALREWREKGPMAGVLEA